MAAEESKMDYSGQRVLVTGGAGFLGINLTRYLLARGHRVTCYDIAEFDYEDCKDQVNKRGSTQQYL